MFVFQRLSDFMIFLSLLFYSITVEEKKIKKCLTLKEGTFPACLVQYDFLDKRIILRRYLGDCFFKIL